MLNDIFPNWRNVRTHGFITKVSPDVFSAGASTYFGGSANVIQLRRYSLLAATEHNHHVDGCRCDAIFI